MSVLKCIYKYYHTQSSYLNIAKIITLATYYYKKFHNTHNHCNPLVSNLSTHHDNSPRQLGKGYTIAVSNTDISDRNFSGQTCDYIYSDIILQIVLLKFNFYILTSDLYEANQICLNFA